MYPANQSGGTNTNDVVYPLGVRRVAGTSAMAGYQTARVQRRRGAVAVVAFLALAAVAGWAGLRTAGRTGWWLGAAGVTLVALAWLARPLPDPERWLRGAAGEAATARILDRLPSRWAVLHDRSVPGSRANIDHLVIGPSGVWVVDTKTTRARVTARWRTVYFGDVPLDTVPVRWEAQVVADRLGVPARPVIVVHGAGLRRRGGRSGGVRVVPVGGLRRYLRRHASRSNRTEVAGLVARAEAVFFPAGQSVEKGRAVRG
jgi:hypothetical protein